MILWFELCHHRSMFVGVHEYKENSESSFRISKRVVWNSWRPQLTWNRRVHASFLRLMTKLEMDWTALNWINKVGMGWTKSDSLNKLGNLRETRLNQLLPAKLVSWKDLPTEGKQQTESSLINYKDYKQLLCHCLLKRMLLCISTSLYGRI